MVQIITVSEVKAAALEAYNEGRLLAQCEQSEGIGPGYGYEVKFNGRTMVCAIGAVLNRDSLIQIKEDDHQCSTIGVDLSELSHIFNCANVDYDGLVEIQSAHDKWLSAKARGAICDVQFTKQTFLSLIQA